MNPSTLRVALAGLLFLLSGATALVYQVAWQRLLALHSGVGLYSVTMIVAAFMAGLGLGSLVGGHISTRLSPGRALGGFALLELLIGGFGAGSTWIYYDWLYPWAVHLESSSWTAGLAHLGALLPPTLLMGMSLPFLVRAVVVDVRGAGRRIGWLYGVNLLGAAAGALAAPWWLLPAAGIRGAVLAAAGVNVLVGLGALLLGRASTEDVQPLDEPSRSPSLNAEAPGARPLPLWLGLYGLSGFVALSLEIVWFRILDVAVKSTAFTFGTLLAFYLLGSGLGSLVAAGFVGRIRRPLRAFLLAQCALVALSALSVTTLVAVPPGRPLADWYLQYWAAYEFFAFGHAADTTSLLRLYGVLPLALFFVPTVLMGLSFPILQRAVQDDPAASGRRVGTLQAANIAGCVAGSLLVGLVTLEALGTMGTLQMLVGCGVVFALVGAAAYGRRFAVVALALALVGGLMPGSESLWRRLHGIVGDVGLVFFEEDGTGVVALTPDGAEWRLSINGKGNSWIPFGRGHTILGAMPASVHPAPRRVGIVGLGSGDTAWAAAYRTETEALTVFEISRPQPRILWRLVGLVDVTDLRILLENPRLTIRLEDGRKALEAEPDTYDFLEADATWPETAGSGNLYSVEFFRAAAARLGPGGLMCTWAPTRRTYRTFRSVFPHAIEDGSGGIVIGSREPIPFEPETWVARARAGEPYLGASRVEEVVRALRDLRPSTAPLEGTLNRDLFPRDELAVPQD